MGFIIVKQCAKSVPHLIEVGVPGRPSIRQLQVRGQGDALTVGQHKHCIVDDALDDHLKPAHLGMQIPNNHHYSNHGRLRGGQPQKATNFTRTAVVEERIVHV